MTEGYQTKKVIIDHDCSIVWFDFTGSTASVQTTREEHPVRNIVEDRLHFIWHNQFYACLTALNNEDDERAKTEMVLKWIEKCQNESVHKDDIGDFRKESIESNAQNAVRWYSSNSCFYRYINEAFRTEDIALIYLNRYLVKLICRQLRTEHKIFMRKYQENTPSRILRLYRGQKIKQCDVDLIRKNLNQLMTFNGFLSTSLEERVAKTYMNRYSTTDLQKVLFEIDVDTSLEQSTYFADISGISRFPQEKEVLFAVGAVLRIHSVQYDSNLEFYRIRLSLSQKDQLLVNNYIEQTYANDDNSVNQSILFGKLLFEMNELQLAVDYLKSIYGRLPKDNSDIQAVYFNNLGVCSNGIRDFIKAEENYERALRVYEKANNARGLGSCYHNVSD